MKLAENIMRLAKERGLPLSRLAREAKIPVQTLHNWTTGRTSVNPDQIRKVAEVLKVSLHFLVFGEPDPHESPSQEVLKEMFAGDVRVTLHRIERKKP